MDNRQIVREAFEAWQAGTAYISEIFADDMRWTIVGQSLVSRVYNGKQAFVDEVLHPFAQRFAKPFRPARIHGIYADGDTVIVLWDGDGTANDGAPYLNTYAWFMTLREGRVVEGTTFYDAIAFNDLWTRVPARA